MSHVAIDPAQRVAELISLTERLTALLTDEAEAFEQRRPQDAAASMPETLKLANAYRHESARVKADPGLIAGAPAERRARLVNATQAFEFALQRQGRAVEAAKTVTEGLVRAIAEEIAVQRPTGTGYGPGADASGPAATAITLNRTA